LRESIEGRIQVLLEEGASGDAVADLLAEGYAYGLLLGRERLALERAIDELAGRLEEPDAAHALRRAWLRHRALEEELRQLHDMLRRLRESHAGAAAPEHGEGRA
jgi:hypothetical protein